MRFLVARLDGEIAGALTLVMFPIPTGPRAWIKDVVVDEAARGRGIGKALTAEAVRLARADGARTVDPHWRHGKLDAVQAHRLLRDESFSSLLRNRIGYSPVAEAVELEALAESVTLSRPPRSLPELLRPQAETVRFVGRDAQLAEFRAWCDGDGVTARLLAGPGGQGKTRFAQELGRALAVEGWVVAQLRDSAPPESYRSLGKVSANLLLIMDYADTLPGSVAEVMRVLEEEGNRGAVRVLLIARSAGEWWQHLPASATAHVSMLSGAIVVQLDRQTGEATGASEHAVAIRRADRRRAVYQREHRPHPPGPDPGQDRLPPPRRPDPPGPAGRTRLTGLPAAARAARRRPWVTLPTGPGRPKG